MNQFNLKTVFFIFINFILFLSQIQNIGGTFSTLKINAGNQAESEICDKIKSIKNGIDPRSPAVDFDRTPILKIRTLEHSKSSELQRNSRRLKKNISNLDISIRSSYCEDANSCHIPEIHALQDIILSWNKSYDVDLSSITDNLQEHKSNNIDHDNKLFPEKLFSEESNDTFKIKEYLEIDKQDCNNFRDSTEYINSFIASEEKFFIWKDSSELLSIPPIYVSNQLKNNLTSKIENEEISMQSRDSNNLNCTKNNYRTDLDKIHISAHTYEKIKENVKITKENLCSKMEVKVSQNKKSMKAVNQNLIDLSKVCLFIKICIFQITNFN